MNELVTPDHLMHYQSHGYFIAPALLANDDVAAIKLAIHQALETPELERKGNYDPELSTRQGAGLAERSRYRKLGQFARHNADVFNRGIAHPKLLAVMHHFLGDDLVLVYDSVFLKLAKTGGATPWHQDIGLWPEKMHQSFNFWIAIDAANRSNGCMQFVPGSHLGNIIEHKLYENAVHKELPRELTQNLKTDFIELAPGDAVFWHSNLWHYSGPNTSDHDRIAIAGVYLTPQCAAQSPKAQGSMVWVARDKKRCPWPLQKFSESNAATGGY